MVVNFVACAEGELPSDGLHEDCTAEKGRAHIKEETTDLLPSPSISDDDKKLGEGCPKVGDVSSIAESPGKKFPQGGLLSCSTSSSSTLKRKSPSRKVAFVAVKNPVAPTETATGIDFKGTATTNATGIDLKGIENESGNKEDSFFNLLTAGNTKDTLF